ncbi:RimK family alpha-L-glutamate ligase [Embleya sp. NBC_00896]|uniref:ATP-grasp domain-containing protein n=1 Tax=Embleya sp. NBC_00896 TaxID=2975961 RepID=UPI003863459A|nr:alpha-L-glutamate ligase [Embleya sp. NBC_00896]
MRICFVTDRPDHPLLADARTLLTPRHEVTVLDPDGDLDSAPVAADVYLLKARTPKALAFAARAERRGARVLNSASATRACQDRVRMAEIAWAAGLPFPATHAFGSPARLLATGPAYPLMVKSRHSRRHDLVARVDDIDALRATAGEWPDEPIVAQEFVDNGGWDHKLWVVDGHVFAGLRRTALDGPAETKPIAAEDLPPGWAALARRVGAAFGLAVYGVDILEVEGRPSIIDVNAFPGMRGMTGAPTALAELAVRAGESTGPRSRAGVRTNDSMRTGRPR